MPTTEIELTDGGINVVELLKVTKLVPSNGEAKRLIQQGGVAIDDEKVTDIAYVVKAEAFEKGHIVIKKGKKVYHKAVLKA